MYLALLNENEKVEFLELAYNLATIDGDYSEAEKNMIAGYCQELQIEFDEKAMVNPMDELIKKIAQNSNEKTKKIIIFELIGLAMADENYDNDERKIIANMENEFGVPGNFANTCENILNEYITFQNRINSLVIG